MAKVSFPARCAVAVVCGENLISQVYPASVPIEMFLDDVVELLTNELRRRGLTGLDPAIAYQLNRANGTTLDVTKTLDELGVEDGTTLVLVPATDGEPFEPQYESLSTGLARVGKRMFQPVTAATAAHTAIAIVAMIEDTPNSVRSTRLCEAPADSSIMFRWPIKTLRLTAPRPPLQAPLRQRRLAPRPFPRQSLPPPRARSARSRHPPPTRRSAPARAAAPRCSGRTPPP